MAPRVVVVDRIAALDEVWRAGLTPALAPRLIMESQEAQGSEPLPATWETTTDSIAARVAMILGARCLFLLKSASPLGIDTRSRAAQLGYVDPVFPSASAALEQVWAANLRADPLEMALLS
jgi:aspartokinase-like uncharacterized kinase